MIKLKDKVALIVGGTGSIGGATALAFARQQSKIIIVGRDEGAANEVLELVNAAGSEGVFIHCDLTDPASVESLAEQAPCGLRQYRYRL